LAGAVARLCLCPCELSPSTAFLGPVAQKFNRGFVWIIQMDFLWFIREIPHYRWSFFFANPSTASLNIDGWGTMSVAPQGFDPGPLASKGLRDRIGPCVVP